MYSSNLSLFMESNKFWGFLALSLPLLVLLLIVLYPVLRKINPSYRKAFWGIFYKIGLILSLAFLMAVFPLIVCDILEVELIKIFLIAIASLVVSTYFILINYIGIQSFFKEWLKVKKK